MELNEQIKKYRTEMNLSQEELAEKIYVTRQSVSNWENGKTYPDIHSLLLRVCLVPWEAIRIFLPAAERAVHPCRSKGYFCHREVHIPQEYLPFLQQIPRFVLLEYTTVFSDAV